MLGESPRDSIYRRSTHSTQTSVRVYQGDGSLSHPTYKLVNNPLVLERGVLRENSQALHHREMHNKRRRRSNTNIPVPGMVQPCTCVLAPHPAVNHPPRSTVHTPPTFPRISNANPSQAGTPSLSSSETAQTQGTWRGQCQTQPLGFLWDAYPASRILLHLVGPARVLQLSAPSLSPLPRLESR